MGKSNNKDLERFKAKWPEDVGGRGFAPIPKCLFTCLGELGLTPLEVVVLGNIIEKCWKAGDEAWFSVDYLARNIGKRKSATKNATRNLAEKGFISKKRQFNSTNIYSLEPTAKKLAEHMPHCRHWAGNSAKVSQKNGFKDSQEPGSYIEAYLNRNHDIESNINSRDSTKDEADDHRQKNDEYIYSVCSSNGRHTWKEFTIEKPGRDGELATHYYFVCESCGLQFHKKGEKPWPGEY